MRGLWQINSLVLLERLQVLFEVLVLDFNQITLLDSSILQLVLEPTLLQVLADDDKEALSFLIGLPLRVRDTAEEHANRVEHELIVAVFDRQKAFHSINVLAFLAQNLVDESVCTFHRDVTVHLVREGSDSGVVFVLLLLIIEHGVVDLHGSVDAEHVEVEQLLKRQLLIVELDLLNNSLSVVLANLSGSLVQLLSVAKINFVEEDLVGKADLLDSLVDCAWLSFLLHSHHDLG